jgi:hypothetical protein
MSADVNLIEFWCGRLISHLLHNVTHSFESRQIELSDCSLVSTYYTGRKLSPAALRFQVVSLTMKSNQSKHSHRGKGIQTPALIYTLIDSHHDSYPGAVEIIELNPSNISFYN